MKIFNPNELSDLIIDFITRDTNAALFAGAGVGVRAGLPNWSQFLDHLATIAGKYSETEGKLIRERARDGHFIKAAQVYKSSPSIPQGELYKQIARPFRNPPSPEKLNALISLPFSAIFTTNYDRSLHHSYASVVGRDAQCVELEDPTMKSAPFMLDFYIARMHGRVEVPETIVIDESDYTRIDTAPYNDFVVNCFTRYRCLFVGFSFLDPAITRVFHVVDDRLGPNFSSLHIAVLPQDASNVFVDEIQRFNIQPALYEAGMDHSNLWEGIEIASRAFVPAEKVDKPKASIPVAATHKFISAAYARLKLGPGLIPLRDLVIDGIILEILSTQSNKAVEIDDIPARLRDPLSLPMEECLELADKRVRHLAGQGLCNIDGSKLILNTEVGTDLAEDMETLAEGVLNRLLVRHGVQLDDRYLPAIVRVLEDTLITRGWDLGASYVGSGDLEEIDLRPTVRASIARHQADLSPDAQKSLTLACVDLFQSPGETESDLLAQLGRISFALQLVLNSPSSILTHEILLPHRIFLDSNVLMRAIVDGHPSRPVYVDAFRRLNQSSHEVGREIPFYVQHGFLNEVLSHREIAFREVEELGLEDPDELRHHILFYGAERVNVFIAAYSSWVGRLEERVGFGNFLNEVAPYRNLKELIKFLEKQGMEAFSYRGDARFSALFGSIHTALRDAYELDARSRFDRKEPILIENEARQLTLLAMDIEQSLRSIFVSGDRRLQRCCSGPILSKPGSVIISNRQFVQLVDLLLGLETDESSMARLLWGTMPTDESLILLNYFTDLALRHYSRAKAKALPIVLNSFVPDVIETAKKEGVSLFPGGTLESKSVRARFLDRFEDQFYEYMAEAIKDLGDI